jgi:hypothetical protein
MPESWDTETYRERAATWRLRATLLPEDSEEARICVEIAQGYERLADLIEAERGRFRDPPV